MDGPIKFIPTKSMTLPERLERHAYYEPNSGCILWGGPTQSQGKYGVMCWEGKARGVHILAWIAANGPTSEGMVIRHRCDTTLCINPDHLVSGTQADNMRDKVTRGRQPRGSEMPWARLTEEQVIEARRRCSQGELAESLAVEMGVSRANMYRVVSGELWKHVPMPEAVSA